jgi:hypothetical protein
VEKNRNPVAWLDPWRTLTALQLALSRLLLEGFFGAFALPFWVDRSETRFRHGVEKEVYSEKFPERFSEVLRIPARNSSTSTQPRP